MATGLEENKINLENEFELLGLQLQQFDSETANINLTNTEREQLKLYILSAKEHLVKIESYVHNRIRLYNEQKNKSQS